MAVPDFDYENFAQNLAAQAQELVPAEFEEHQKQYIVNTLDSGFNMTAQFGHAMTVKPSPKILI